MPRRAAARSGPRGGHGHRRDRAVRVLGIDPAALPSQAHALARLVALSHGPLAAARLAPGCEGDPLDTLFGTVSASPDRPSSPGQPSASLPADPQPAVVFRCSTGIREAPGVWIKASGACVGGALGGALGMQGPPDLSLPVGSWADEWPAPDRCGPLGFVSVGAVARIRLAGPKLLPAQGGRFAGFGESGSGMVTGEVGLQVRKLLSAPAGVGPSGYRRVRHPCPAPRLCGDESGFERAALMSMGRPSSLVVR